MKQVKYTLDEKQIPTEWYNIQADLPKPLPPVLHPGTKEPIGPQDLAPLFPMELIKQEVSTERYIEIPEEVRDIYRPFTGRGGWKRRWTPPQKSTTSMKVPVLREAINPIPLWPRHITTKRKASIA